MRSFQLIAAVAVMLGLFTSGYSATLYVSPAGSDNWSGRLSHPNADRSDGPLASLGGARDAIRKMRSDGGLLEGIDVLVADGQYPLRETFVLTAEDSGTAAHPIRYQAAPGAQPVFTGGRRITGFQQAPDGRWVAEIPEVESGDWYFEQLWINDRRAVRARSPNKFYFHVVPSSDWAVDSPGSCRRIRAGANGNMGLDRHVARRIPATLHGFEVR